MLYTEKHVKTARLQHCLPRQKSATERCTENDRTLLAIKYMFDSGDISSHCVLFLKDMAGDDEDITFCSMNCFMQFELSHQAMSTDEAKVRTSYHYHI